MIPTGRQAVYISATHLMPNLEIETRSLSLKTKKYLVVCAASHLLIICVDSVGKSIVEFSESNKLAKSQKGKYITLLRLERLQSKRGYKQHQDHIKEQPNTPFDTPQ
jgi:hypothetical protein